MTVYLYVEGGGDSSKVLKGKCRKGFRKLIEKAGLSGHMPKITACGSRQHAYDDFVTAQAWMIGMPCSSSIPKRP